MSRNKNKKRKDFKKDLTTRKILKEEDKLRLLKMITTAKF